MISFGEYLCSYMQRCGYSISSIASKAKIDRTLLSKTISGSRSLNKLTFKKLVAALEPTMYELETLTNLYAVSYFGEDKYNNIQQLKKFYTKTSNSDTSKSFPDNFYCSSTNLLKTSVISDHYTFKDCINSFLNFELDNETPSVYSNFPFNCDYINDLLLSKIAETDKNIDFRHIVCFSAGDRQNDEIQSITRAIQYKKIGYNTHYYISGDSENHNFDCLFPFYIILSDKIIHFNENLNDAIICYDIQTVAKYREEFRKKLTSCQILVSNVGQDYRPRDIILPYCSSSHEFISLSNKLSIFITNQTAELLEFDLNDISALRYIHELCDINSHILSDFNFYTFILNKRAITDFISSGEIFGTKKEFNIRIPEHNRHKFLKYILDFIQQKNVSFSMTTEKFSQLNENIMITIFKSEVYRDDVIFTDFSNTDLKNNDSQCMMINNFSIVQNYSDFIDYLALFSYTDSEEASISYIENQVEFAFGLPQQ